MYCTKTDRYRDTKGMVTITYPLSILINVAFILEMPAYKY